MPQNYYYVHAYQAKVKNSLLAFLFLHIQGDTKTIDVLDHKVEQVSSITREYRISSNNTFS